MCAMVRPARLPTRIHCEDVPVLAHTGYMLAQDVPGIAIATKLLPSPRMPTNVASVYHRSALYVVQSCALPSLKGTVFSFVKVVDYYEFRSPT